MTEDIRIEKGLRIALTPPTGQSRSAGDEAIDALVEQIVRNELSDRSWTLMHRFNLCHELLDRVAPGNVNALALLFVWLRFSAIRQLDWQRRYNTQPRELSHALDRLTLKVATRYAAHHTERPLLRLILTTLGRGGAGQRVRDEVLNIMHRHHVKEVSGHFMEEWHQKLHNNTTPDDIVICEALLAFLRSDGRLDVFNETLEAGGVNRERLRSYERAIKSDPDFIPYLKDPLIHDFEQFLAILKGVHSGTDLGAAIDGARHLFEPHVHETVAFIWDHRHDSGSVGAVVSRITDVRRIVRPRLDEQHDVTAVRDWLFLDVALEMHLRTVVESSLQRALPLGEAVDLAGMLLENTTLSNGQDEMTLCLESWRASGTVAHTDSQWALRIEAVTERVRRAIAGLGDWYFQMLQPNAERLGTDLHVAAWTITLFAEEVVRGLPAFVLPPLLQQLDRQVRQEARLPTWEVISRAPAAGQVVVVDSLASIQGTTFDRATVIVTGVAAGNEEIPGGVTAIFIPTASDILSHLAIRARNAHILFASCRDGDEFERLKRFAGHAVAVDQNGAGEIVFREASDDAVFSALAVRPIHAVARPPGFTTYAVASDRFTQQTVGKKSYNLRRLEQIVPDWIGVPASVALPFGVFERVLADPVNCDVAIRYAGLVAGAETEPASGARFDKAVLALLRLSVLDLHAPGDLLPALRAAMEGRGFAWPRDEDGVWTAIKRVWASKWNDRAYLSRRANLIGHDDLVMAVLVQQVVEADYAFVVHTVNPSSGDRREMYGEVVLGLGETLVGNHPGRALSFTARKQDAEPRVLTFPSKSLGLYGGNLIFRSDSNGEDLGGYAGAGLYDSVTLEPSREVLLDYARERLVRDDGFRTALLGQLARLAGVLEDLMGTPLDIEGAYANGRWWVAQARPQVGLDDA
jgi:alpha-glucan,water dikinase